LGLIDVTRIETSVAGVTVNITAGEVTVPSVALIRVLPIPTDVANPLVLEALSIVATDAVVDAHVT